MPVPFGVSVGDFIAVIGVFVKVCEALKDSGGAVSEYRQTVTQLERMQAIIAQVEKLKIPSANPKGGDIASIVNALCGQGAECRSLLTQFITRVKDYDPALGSKAPQGFHRHVWTKGKWALYFTKELDTIRKVISAQTEAINLQFQLLLAALSEATIQNQTAQNVLLTDHISSQQSNSSTHIVDHVASHFASNERRHLAKFEEQKIHLDDSFADMRVYIKGIVRKRSVSDQEIVSTLQALQTELISQRALLNPLLRSLPNQFHQERAHMLTETPTDSRHTHLPPEDFRTSSNLSLLQAQRSDVAIGAPVKAFIPGGKNASEIFTSYILYLIDKMKEVVGATMKCDPCDPDFRHASYQLMRTIGEFATLLSKHIRTLASFLIYAFMYFKILLPKLMLITSSISLHTPLQLNIIFEDVLGRQHGLPFHYFRHWNTFKSMLKHEFRDCPGEEKVLRGDYRLMNVRRYYSVLSADNWDATVEPGTRIVMSILIERLRRKKDVCQKEGCQGSQEEKGENRIVCNTCGLELYYSPPTSTPKVVEIPDEAVESNGYPIHNGREKSGHTSISTPIRATGGKDVHKDKTTSSQRSTNPKLATINEESEHQPKESRRPEPAQPSSRRYSDEGLHLFRRIHTTDTEAFPTLPGTKKSQGTFKAGKKKHTVLFRKIRRRGNSVQTKEEGFGVNTPSNPVHADQPTVPALWGEWRSEVERTGQWRPITQPGHSKIVQFRH